MTTTSQVAGVVPSKRPVIAVTNSSVVAVIVAGTSQISIEVTAVRPLPLIWIWVPPLCGPWSGKIESTLKACEGSLGVKVKSSGQLATTVPPIVSSTLTSRAKG